jgi:hypothetical protein
MQLDIIPDHKTPGNRLSVGIIPQSPGVPGGTVCTILLNLPGHNYIVTVPGIHVDPLCHLPDISQTAGPFRRRPGFGKSRQQHSRQNGNDGNDYKQFDQGKAARLYPPMGGTNSFLHTKNPSCFSAFQKFILLNSFVDNMIHCISFFRIPVS